MGRIFNHISNVLIPETGSKDGRYAKMLVKIDLTKPLIRGTRIRCKEESYWISFKYEQLHFLCFYCGRLGHSERSCEHKWLDAANSCIFEGQFGDWLRAISMLGSSTSKRGGGE